MTTIDFQSQLQDVLAQINQACLHANRNFQEVQLLAVSKTHPAASISELYQLGQKAFGENYLQEALEKIEQFSR